MHCWVVEFNELDKNRKPTGKWSYLESYRTRKEAAPFRWSYYQTIMQVTLGALLRGAAGGCPEGSSIGEIWRRYVEAPDAPRDNFSGYESLAPEPRLSLAERLEESLATHPLGETERLHVLALLRPMVEERVRTVVRAKTSDWYPDVAALITALAEALALTGRTTQAKRIHNGLVVDFPRHRGFRREMNDALQASPILRGP